MGAVADDAAGPALLTFGGCGLRAEGTPGDRPPAGVYQQRSTTAKAPSPSFSVLVSCSIAMRASPYRSRRVVKLRQEGGHLREGGG
jgi:hypothetical protein